MYMYIIIFFSLIQHRLHTVICLEIIIEHNLRVPSSAFLFISPVDRVRVEMCGTSFGLSVT